MKFFESGTKIPAGIIEPITRLRKDSGLPLPAIDEKIAELTTKLPKFIFEEKILALFAGDMEDFLPPLPFERR